MNDVELMNKQMEHITKHICPDPECHVIKVLLEAQAEHQAEHFNKLDIRSDHDLWINEDGVCNNLDCDSCWREENE